MPSTCFPACSVTGGKNSRLWVQGSHGMNTGPDDHYVMTDDWIDAYVLSAVIRKNYLLPEMLALLDAPVYMPKEERF